MPNYIFAYHGGSTPETEAAQKETMARWTSWMETHAAAFVDRGAPVGQSSTVSKDGVADNGGANPLSGYSIVTAADLDAAIAVAKGCPILDEGSIEIAEIHEM